MEQPPKVWRIGIDEAGYGPNLGPLVVAATAWLAPTGKDLYDLLADAVTAKAAPDDDRIVIADSKVVYSSGSGVALLERAVYAGMGSMPATWCELVAGLGADHATAMNTLPWHVGFDPALPFDAVSGDVASGVRLLRDALGDDTPRLAARMVFPAEFNALVATHGTKGAALSHVSIGLARRLFDLIDNGQTPVEFTFDKHGGRNRYGALLQEHFPEGWVETRDEARAASHYRLGERLTFTFRTKGEAELPVALASMTAKLLRELSMEAFNAFWLKHVPGLKPTAGYPIDAKRFKKEIAAKQLALGIDDDALWRNR